MHQIAQFILNRIVQFTTGTVQFILNQVIKFVHRTSASCDERAGPKRLRHTHTHTRAHAHACGISFGASVILWGALSATVILWGLSEISDRWPSQWAQYLSYLTCVVVR
eukprot:1360098-Pyramimonas_sp.AAC.1